MTAIFDAALSAAGLPDHWSWQVELRARRRTLGLDVLPNGSILIAVPPGVEPYEVAETVRSRRLWLAKALRRRAEVAAGHPTKEIVDGEGFAYLGRRYRLLLVDDQPSPVSLRGGWLRLRRQTDDQAGAASIVEWYTSRGARWLTDRVGRWAGRLGAPAVTVTVLDLGTRWGLRNRDRSVSFHWAVMQLEPEVVDLVVVHELVHLLVPRHDEDFRQRMLLAMPDATDREAQLADDGRRVWMGAVRGRPD